MKDEWQTRPLGDLLEVQNGFAFDSKSFNPTTGTPLIRIRDLKGGAETKTRFTGEFDEKYLVRAGDLLIGMDGDFGCYEWKGDPALLNQRVCRLQEFTSDLLPRFLFYGVNSHLKAIEDVTGFATVKHLSSRQILGIEFPVPSRTEQKRIVAILDEAFEGIATARACSAMNLENARALFAAYLSFVFTKQGEEWVRKTLREVASDFGRGKSKHRPRNDPRLYGGSYPFIQTGDVRNSEHEIHSYTQTYNEFGLAQSKLWPVGTLCITIAANIAETGVLGFEACFPDSVIGLLADETQSSSKFIEYLLQHFKTDLQARGKGSAQDNINLATFENMTFPFPSLELQASVVSTLDSLRVETQRLESIYQRKIAALDTLKKSLLYHAFSGQL